MYTNKTPLTDPLYVISNPQAGQNDESVQYALKTELRGLTDAKFFTNADDLPLGDMRQKGTRLLIAGGDGSVHYALKKMYDELGTFLPFGIIPVGSGNILARSLGISSTLHTAVKNFLRGTPQHVDGILINDDHLSVIGTSIGTHATVVKKTTRPWKKILGVNAYYIRLVPHLFPIHQYAIQWSADDGELQTTHANTVLLVNTLAAFKVAPFGNIAADDGKIHVFFFHHEHAFDVLKDFVQIPIKNGVVKHVTHIIVDSIRFAHSDGIPLQVDGEFRDYPLRSARVLPRALPIIY